MTKEVTTAGLVPRPLLPSSSIWSLTVAVGKAWEIWSCTVMSVSIKPFLVMYIQGLEAGAFARQCQSLFETLVTGQHKRWVEHPSPVCLPLSTWCHLASLPM